MNVVCNPFSTRSTFSRPFDRDLFDEKWPIFAWQPFMIAGNASQTLGNKRKCLGINDGSIYSNMNAGIEYRMMANQSPSGQSTGSAHFPISRAVWSTHADVSAHSFPSIACVLQLDLLLVDAHLHSVSISSRFRVVDMTSRLVHWFVSPKKTRPVGHFILLERLQ